MKSDSSTSSVALEGLDLDLNEREDSGASGPVITTSMPTRSTQPDLGTQTIAQVTLDKLTPTQSPILNFSVLDSLAKHFQSRARGKDLRIFVERYFLKSYELSKLKNHAYYYLKMLRASYTTIKDLRSKSSLNRWMNWGIMSNGRCLTASSSAYHNIEKDCILSGILEIPLQEPMLYSTTVDASGYLRKLGGWNGKSMSQRTIRKYTPHEAERLQGFPDDWTLEISDNQRLKCLGNAVTVNVIEFLGHRILGSWGK